MTASKASTDGIPTSFELGEERACRVMKHGFRLAGSVRNPLVLALALRLSGAEDDDEEEND